MEHAYYTNFRTLEDRVGSESFVFIDEVDFEIETRPVRERSLINTLTYHDVPLVRSKI